MKMVVKTILKTAYEFIFLRLREDFICVKSVCDDRIVLISQPWY